MGKKRMFLGDNVNFSTNLLAAYQFEDNVNDTTGNHNGTITGTVSFDSSSKVGKAASFQGSSDYITVSDHDDWSFGDGSSDVPFSVSFWFRINTFSTSDGHYFLIKRAATSLREYQIFISSSKELTFSLLDESENIAYIAIKYDMSSEYADVTYFHVAFTYDGSGNDSGMNIYLDGVKKTTSSASSGVYTAMENLTSNVVIGTRWDVSTGEMFGRMDELMVWRNRELSESEVFKLYEKQNAGIDIL